MNSSQADDFVKRGVEALKAGDKDEARRLLLQVVENDEGHELAWLWLSAAVRDKEDKIVCLENVLTLNPQNKKALKGLAKLKGASSTNSRQIVRRELTPLSGAQAILFPERQVMEWEWKDPTTAVSQAKTVGYRAKTAYDDVWSRNAEICPYCATETVAEDKRCPLCKRPLFIKQFRYAKTTPNVTLYWVLLLGLANINLIQVIFDFIYWADIVGVLINILLVGLFLTVAIGSMLRQFWAFITSQILLIIVLFLAGVEAFFSFRLVSNRFPPFDPAITRFIESLGSGFDSFLNQFEIGGAVIALILAIFFLAPDFEKINLRLIAQSKDGLPNGADYHLKAKRSVELGQWATAVKHWQRAAAKEPHRLLFLQNLANAYLHLNFFQRSLDVLQSAKQLTTNQSKKEVIQKQIDNATAKQVAYAQKMEHK
ncbi:MAG: tetratricopeptide repeat protein [Chloroflexota bacterium]